MIQVNLNNIQAFVGAGYEAELAPRVREAHDKLQLGTGAGSDFFLFSISFSISSFVFSESILLLSFTFSLIYTLL